METDPVCRNLHHQSTPPLELLMTRGKRFLDVSKQFNFRQQSKNGQDVIDYPAPSIEVKLTTEPDASERVVIIPPRLIIADRNV